VRIRALIVDDEALARKRVRRLLAGHPDVEVDAEAGDGGEALALVLDRRPDLIFLDVNMPGQDGLGALERIQELLPEGARPLVIFTTAYEEHALRAFELEGLDYLVKPIEQAALDRALRRVRRALGGAHERGGKPAVPGPGEGTGASGGEIAEAGVTAAGHLAAVRGEKILSLALADVGCIQLEDGIAYAHTPTGKQRLRQNLTELEERLPAPPFQRVSRSALVNLDWVAHLEPLFSGSYLATLKAPLGLELQVSRRRARRLRELLGR